MKNISQKRKQRNKRRIKKERSFVAIQNGKAEKRGKEGRICNQKGTFGG